MTEDIKVVFIPWQSPKKPFPGANEMEDAARCHWSTGYKLRKKWKQWFILHMVTFPKRRFKRVWLYIIYYERMFGPPHGRDPDNIVAIKKILLDAMVDAEIIPDDKHENIAGWTESFVEDPKNPGIRLRISDHTEDKSGEIKNRQSGQPNY